MNFQVLTAAFVAPNQLDAEKEATWTNMTDGWEWALGSFHILTSIDLLVHHRSFKVK